MGLTKWKCADCGEWFRHKQALPFLTLKACMLYNSPGKLKGKAQKDAVVHSRWNYCKNCV